MKYYLIAPFVGMIFPLGFSPFNIWPLTIFSLSALLYLIKKVNFHRSFLIGFLYGFGLWGFGISWVYVSIYYYGNLGFIISFLITLVFIIFLSFYIGLTTYLFKRIKVSKMNVNYLLIFPVLWVSIELIRSYLLTGFPWLIIGTSLAGTSLGGWIPILGSYGGSVLVLMISGSLLLIYENSFKLNLYPALLICIILISSFILNKINWTSEVVKIKASIYQPNLTLHKKWSTEGIKQTTDLIQEAIVKGEEGEFVFFPETALILDKEEMEPFISDIENKAVKKNISLISGIIAKDVTKRHLKERFNRIEAFGSAQGSYDKVHLVPFGEYIPLRNYLGTILDIMGINLVNTLPGKSFTQLKSRKVIISPSICYEIAFNNLVRKTAKNSNLLVTISNDTWFGSSIGPEQHLQIAQSRALEHQKSLIRATNSGISAFISRKGKILDKQGFFEDKLLKNEVEIYEGRTPYAVTGNSLIYIYLSIVFLYLLYNKRTNVTKSKRKSI